MTTEVQNLNSVLLAQVQQAKEQNLLEDQSQDTFVSRTIPAGKAVARLIGYVELGLQPQTYNGKPTDPAEEVMITFELHNPPWNKEAGFSVMVDEKDANGNPTGNKKAMPTRMTIRLTKKLNAKAKFRKLWTKLTEGKGADTNFALLLGEAYLVDVKHEKSTKDPNKSFATLYTKDSGYHIGRPVAMSMTEGEQVIPVPPVTLPMQLFLQSMPTKEQWATIYIDGEREVEQADGTKKNVSKNYIQETILKSLNYRGSRLELMLNGHDKAVDALVSATQTQSAAPQSVSTAVAEPAPVQEVKQAVAPAQEAAPLAAPVQAATPVTVQTAEPAPAQTDTSTVKAVETGSANPANDVAAAMEAMFGPQA